MNEKIKQLMGQTLDEKFAGTWSTMDMQDLAKFSERFAELIVRECAKKCEFIAAQAEITNTGEMARKTKATADSCAKMIKQHFGVEE